MSTRLLQKFISQTWRRKEIEFEKITRSTIRTVAV